MSKKAIGIDLGTSKCCVGVVRDGKVEILENERSNKTTPSYVAFTDKELLVGEDARDQAARNPDNTISCVKRFLGRHRNDLGQMTSKIVLNEEGEHCFRVSYKNSEMLLLPQQVSAMLLVKMKKIAEDHLKSPVKEAVISVPASFSNAQRQATKDAAAIAGLKVLALINETTAAAIAYQTKRRTKSEETIAVVDFGAGKLDTSIVTVDDKNVRVIGVGGSTDVGGNDVDQLLMKEVEFKYLIKHGVRPPQDGGVMERFRSSCENMKIKLSLKPNVQETLDCFSNDKDLPMEINRVTFNNWLPHMRVALITYLQNALNDAKVDMNKISIVLLVGGSTRMPWIQKSLQEHFTFSVNKTVNPDEAVAYGASVQAALLSRDPAVKELAVQEVIGRTIYLTTARKTLTLFSREMRPPRQTKPINCLGDHEVLEVLDISSTITRSIGRFCSKKTVFIRVDSNGIVGIESDQVQNALELKKLMEGQLNKERLEKFAKEVKSLTKDAQKNREREEALFFFEKLRSEFESEIENQQNPELESIQEFRTELEKTINGLNGDGIVTKTRWVDEKNYFQDKWEAVKAEIRTDYESTVVKLIELLFEFKPTPNDEEETESESEISQMRKEALQLASKKWPYPRKTCVENIAILQKKKEERKTKLVGETESDADENKAMDVNMRTVAAQDPNVVNQTRNK